MGRLNHASSRVHTHATQLLTNTTNTFPPPWLSTLRTTPPSQKLIRPVQKRKPHPTTKKSSRIFQPAPLRYEEDKLRWEYFNDHPWELARPRVVLEDDGRDREKWDWGVELDVGLNRPKVGVGRDEAGRTDAGWEGVMRRIAGRPLNGESVVQRQAWLLIHSNLSSAAAYDQARKELYRLRHFREVERRVAREEAVAVGSFFGKTTGEVGMELEDRAYENWRVWAKAETEASKQLQASAYAGNEASESAEGDPTETEQAQLREVSESVPGSKRGLEAAGGAAVHP